MKTLSALITLLTLFPANLAIAKPIFLEPGDSYTHNDINVFCVENKRSSFDPVSISDCQHWDDFNQICLHQKTILTTGTNECVEECQHWDDLYKKCYYKTSCRYDRSEGTFIKTTCFDFDMSSRKCLRLEQTKIDFK